MEKQTLPEALLCADWLEVEPCEMDLRCAAELRRLNAEEVEANLLIEREWQRNKVLSDRIAALEEALEEAVEALDGIEGYRPDIDAALATARQTLGNKK